MNWKERTANKILDLMQGRNLTCEICGGTQWTTSDFINLSVKPEISPSVIIGGPALPLVGLTCNRCGNTKLLNLIVLGVLKQETKTETEFEAEKILEEKRIL